MAQFYLSVETASERSLSADISGQLASGGRVELRGFSAFSIRQRRARKGRNPRSGEQVAVEAKSAVLFRPSREMRARIVAK